MDMVAKILKPKHFYIVIWQRRKTLKFHLVLDEHLVSSNPSVMKLDVLSLSETKRAQLTNPSGLL